MMNREGSLASVLESINRHFLRIGRLQMEVEWQETIYPKPRLSQSGPGHRIYPYLLRGLTMERANQVWSADITYIRLVGSWLYLVAVMDWYSRYVLSWRLSASLESAFCVKALAEALRQGQPEMFNTDQGSQFTSEAFAGRVEQHGIRISMDGGGRALDNVFTERLWRSVKYEEVYLKEYREPAEVSGVCGGTSATTTTNGRIRLWAIARRRKCTRPACCGKPRRGRRRPAPSFPARDL